MQRDVAVPALKAHKCAATHPLEAICSAASLPYHVPSLRHRSFPSAGSNPALCKIEFPASFGGLAAAASPSEVGAVALLLLRLATTSAHTASTEMSSLSAISGIDRLLSIRGRTSRGVV